MISNSKLLTKNNGNVRKTYLERIDIVENLKNSLRVYFKAIGVNGVTISNFNNGDLRVQQKKGAYPLDKLFKAYGLSFNIVNESKTTKTYVIYVFDG